MRYSPPSLDFHPHPGKTLSPLSKNNIPSIRENPPHAPGNFPLLPLNKTTNPATSQTPIVRPFKRRLFWVANFLYLLKSAQLINIRMMPTISNQTFMVSRPIHRLSPKIGWISFIAQNHRLTPAPLTWYTCVTKADRDSFALESGTLVSKTRK